MISNFATQLPESDADEDAPVLVLCPWTNSCFN